MATFSCFVTFPGVAVAAAVVVVVVVVAVVDVAVCIVFTESSISKKSW